MSSIQKGPCEAVNDTRIGFILDLHFQRLLCQNEMHEPVSCTYNQRKVYIVKYYIDGHLNSPRGKVLLTAVKLRCCLKGETLGMHLLHMTSQTRKLVL